MSNLNKENMENQDDDLDFIKKLKPMEAKKSKDEVWAELEKMMAQPLPQEAKVRSFTFRNWSVAASLMLLVSLVILSVMKFYTKNVVAIGGEQAVAYLPDGSKVNLNSKSELSFHPFWWSFDREVTLEGEGFFEVKKGEKFTVVSAQGKTSVLGTSFNIFARDQDYQVTCLTGKVKVSNAGNKDEIIITPNQMAVLNKTGKLTSNLNVDAKIALDWTEGKFIFTQEPLKNVLAEIGRRYGVEFENIDDLNEPYTGYFERQKDIKNVLNIVCKPFNIEYKKSPSGVYTIK